MLRREGLALLDRVYEFVRVHRHSFVRIPDNVIEELCDVRSILPLLHTSVYRPWFDQVHASDASPYGLGVCYRHAGSQVAGEMGRQSERWRFKVSQHISSRKRALGISDDAPANDVLKNLPNSEKLFAGDLRDIPKSFCDPETWRVCLKHVTDRTKSASGIHITQLEGDALSYAVRHCLRNSRSHGKKCVFLVDNMPLCLAVCKGRSSSRLLSQITRELAALSFATGSQFICRWVVSEHNVADAPSRGVRLGGLGKWSPDEVEHSETTTLPSVASKLNPYIAPPSISHYEDHGNTDLPSLDPWQLGDNPAYLSGGEIDSASHVRVLSELPPDIHSVVPGECNQLGVTRRTRRHSCALLRSVVLEWKSLCRRKQDSVSCEILHPDTQSSRPRSSPTGPPRRVSVESIEARTTEATYSRSCPDGNRGVPMRSRRFRDRSCPLVPIPHLHAARDVRPPEGQATHQPVRCLHVNAELLGNQHVPGRRLVTGQDWNVRREHNVRHRSPLDWRVLRDPDRKSKRRGEVVAGHIHADHKNPERCHRGPQAGTTESLPICPEARGRIQRPLEEAPQPGRNQTKRHVENRPIVEALRQRGTNLSRGEEGSSPRGTVRRRRDTVCGCGFPRDYKDKPSSSGALSGSSQEKGSLRKLRIHFKRALRKARRRNCHLFLDLYAGTCGVTKFISRSGYGGIAFDLSLGPEFNLLLPQVHKLIKGWICSGCVAGVMLATECKTWSRARHGPVGTSWGPIRSRRHIMGLPNLCQRDHDKVSLGNKQMAHTADIISACVKHCIPCILENPINSLLFAAKPIHDLLQDQSCVSITTDQCQFGSRWRKRTRFACWHCGDVSILDVRCVGHKGICSLSGKPHIVLRGSGPNGVLWTKLAQEYPSSLSRALSRILIESFEHGILRKFNRICGLCQ